MEQAKYWLTYLANQGDMTAQYRLGLMILGDREFLSKGELEQAKYWLQQAANQGHVSAQFSLSQINQKLRRLNKALESKALMGAKTNSE